MDISYITSCKRDNNVEKRSTDRDKTLFLNDMNLENIYMNHFKR